MALRIDRPNQKVSYIVFRNSIKFGCTICIRLTDTVVNRLKQYVMHAATAALTMTTALPKHCCFQ